MKSIFEKASQNYEPKYKKFKKRNCNLIKYGRKVTDIIIYVLL